MKKIAKPSASRSQTERCLIAARAQVLDSLGRFPGPSRCEHAQ